MRNESNVMRLRTLVDVNQLFKLLYQLEFYNIFFIQI